MIDWDDAFNTMAFIKNPAELVERWAKEAAKARDEMQGTLDIPYGSHDRNKFDLFEPQDQSNGLVVIVHGGFWCRFDKSFWSHLALGTVKAGWTTAIISYPLALEARISAITKAAAKAVNHAAGLVTGPTRLAGHSAGGHLVTRLASSTELLEEFVQERLVRTLSVSGLHDLRPLCQTKLNETLRLTMS